MRIALLVLFGAAGTLARYGLQGIIQERAGSSFPTGTLAVNLLGCFLLGGITEYGLHRLTLPPDWRVGISIGFLGAFTTFSTFSLESFRLMEDGELFRALLYMGISLIGGVIAILLGMRAVELF